MENENRNPDELLAAFGTNLEDAQINEAVPLILARATGKNRDNLQLLLAKVLGGPIEAQATADNVETAGFLNRHMDFAEYRHKAKNADRIGTGFPYLDGALGGGLYPGLYALGGTTGAGKTTFLLQIADYIAAHGNPVLYVALEMGAFELMAKSVSRLTNAHMEGGSPGAGISYLDILNGKESPVIDAAINDHVATIAPNVVCIEGLGDVGPQRIRAMAETMAARGKAPVIVVDYLQIMAPHDPRMTERQAVDYNVVELKRISRDLDTPVLVISSFNRETNKGAEKGESKPGLYSFKESGAIEYTSDVAMVLHKKSDDMGQGYETTEVKICKNRRGPCPSDWGEFQFYKNISAFVDVSEYTGPCPWTKEPAGDYIEV